ncbi:hypothetical protein NDU88_001237 [Pleurodeles waltl]|uniref:Uncharacterized protein n=1 Tax=Pleurodeles waltl TaxID=8319 RepID=A0AAV7U6I0_PLEWA|nr:hypothetical protein NDU88_001237 [Pleurodeles waltl]
MLRRKTPHEEDAKGTFVAHVKYGGVFWQEACRRTELICMKSRAVERGLHTPNKVKEPVNQGAILEL